MRAAQRVFGVVLAFRPADIGGAKGLLFFLSIIMDVML